MSPVDLEQNRRQWDDDERRTHRCRQIDPGRQPDGDPAAGWPSGSHGTVKPAPARAFLPIGPVTISTKSFAPVRFRDSPSSAIG
jgi:hypothetical protein